MRGARQHCSWIPAFLNSPATWGRFLNDATPPGASERRLRVGWDAREYNNMRNIIGSPAPGVERVRTGNLFRYPNYALFRGFNRVDPLFANLHAARPDCDLRHFF